MVKTVIIGSAGRMGRLLVSNVMEDENMQLHGAVEIASCPVVGQDAGIIAGCGVADVKITSNLEEALEGADAVIDFSFAESAIANTKVAVAKGVAAVIGTTGLTNDQKVELNKLAESGKIVFAPNMSVGVNVLFYLCEQAGSLLSDYDIEIVEAHHRHKKDSPSGTALGLAEAVCSTSGHDVETDLVHGREGMVGARTKKEVGMHAVRGGDVIGDHTVMFMTDGERVELTHKASTRQAFTSGALKAAKFLQTKENGMYNMRNVLGLE